MKMDEVRVLRTSVSHSTACQGNGDWLILQWYAEAAHGVLTAEFGPL